MTETQKIFRDLLDKFSKTGILDFNERLQMVQDLGMEDIDKDLLINMAITSIDRIKKEVDESLESPYIKKNVTRALEIWA